MTKLNFVGIHKGLTPYAPPCHGKTELHLPCILLKRFFVSYWTFQPPRGNIPPKQTVCKFRVGAQLRWRKRNKFT